MKFKILLLLLTFYYINLLKGLSQFGSLNPALPVNDDFQLDSEIFSKNPKKLLKKIYSLVNTPSLIIGDKSSPIPSDNLKYIETPDQAIYIIELPSFPDYVIKDDIIIKQGTNGINIEVKDSGLYANNAFFPDLTSETLSSVVRGKNYVLNLKFFQKMKENTTALIQINKKENNCFEIVVNINKKDFVENKYLRKLNKFFSNNIDNTVSERKMKEIQNKFEKEYSKNDEITSDGEKIEIFKKNNEENEKEDKNNLSNMIQNLKKKLKNSLSDNNNKNKNNNEIKNNEKKFLNEDKTEKTNKIEKEKTEEEKKRDEERDKEEKKTNESTKKDEKEKIKIMETSLQANQKLEEDLNSIENNSESEYEYEN